MYTPVEAQPLNSERLQRALRMTPPSGCGKCILLLAFSERIIVDGIWGRGVQRNSTQPYEH